MSMEVNFLSSEFDGATAELHSPLLPFSLVATATITGGTATFGSNLEPFAVRVTSGGATVLRTGVTSQSSGEVDPSGDFSISFLTMRLTDPDDTVIPVSDLEDDISLPITQDDLTITALSLATVGNDIRATGSGTYSAGLLGTIPLDYTYNFDLDPATSAISSKIIVVDTISSSIVGTAGGLGGWVINAIVGLISILFNGKISDEIEKTVQSKVDDSVDAAFAAAGAPSGSMATLLDVTESGGDVTIDPMVCIPLSELDCASFLTSGSVKVRKRDQIRKLRVMRDAVLRGHPQGDAYIAMFKRHSPELIRMLARSPRLLKLADRIVDRGLREFDEKKPGEGVLSGETGQLVRGFMERAGKDASPALRKTIERSLPEIDDFVGKPVGKAFDENLSRIKKRLR